MNPEIETALGGFTKPVLDAVKELKGRVDDLETKSRRPTFEPGVAGGSGDNEYRAAFNLFLRHGDESLLRTRAMSAGSGADGGYTVPEELGREIIGLAREFSPVRQVANVIQVATADFKQVVRVDQFATGWVGETAARPATNTAQFAEVPAVMGEVYSNCQVTQQLLDDSQYPLESWLATELSADFAVAENTAFTTGDGTSKPKGFLGYTTAATADGVRAFGTLEHIPTGIAGDWPATDAAIVDLLIDVTFRLASAYRPTAVWMMPRSVLARVRKLRDDVGQLVFAPSLAAGTPSTLLGYPVIENEAMPAPAANSLSIAFGSFRHGYTVVDRVGTRILRDPFTNKPYVGFYATRRVGGMVVDSQAIKLVRFAAA